MAAPRIILAPWERSPDAYARPAEVLLQYRPRSLVWAGRPGFGAYGGPANLVSDASIVGGNFNFPGSNGYVDLGTAARVINRDSHTVVMVSRLSSFPNTYPIVAGYSDDSTLATVAFYSTDVAYSDFSFGASGAGFGQIKFSLTQFGAVTNTWHAIVIQRRASTTAGHTVFINGLSVTPSDGSTIADRSGNTTLGQSSPSSLTYDFAGQIACFALFDGLLPDSLMQQISADPFGALFEPRRIFVPVPAPASVPTITAVYADSVTGSSVTPRVTLDFA